MLWLEEYLRGYPHTVLLVSHDRAFLNAVCTDIVLFKSQKLNYYRGDYDQYEATSTEERVVQQKQHEAQKVKLQHMQEFVDRFRYNAKKASLVQSRLKAIERESVVEAVVEEVNFKFSFHDSGQLGRPIIQMEEVSFGYGAAPLFREVHLDVDQSSRIALVGPNGAGKVQHVPSAVLSAAGSASAVMLPLTSHSFHGLFAIFHCTLFGCVVDDID